MVKLKSYRLKLKKKVKKKKRVGGLLAQGTTALIGIGLLSETANVVQRI